MHVVHDNKIKNWKRKWRGSISKRIYQNLNLVSILYSNYCCLTSQYEVQQMTNKHSNLIGDYERSYISHIIRNLLLLGLYIRAGSRRSSPASLQGFAGSFHFFKSQDMVRRWCLSGLNLGSIKIYICSAYRLLQQNHYLFTWLYYWNCLSLSNMIVMVYFQLSSSLWCQSFRAKMPGCIFQRSVFKNFAGEQAPGLPLEMMGFSPSYGSSGPTTVYISKNSSYLKP